MDRATLQSIALEKAQDAELLFQNRRYSNSYYLFGYAAEIAIKARIALRFKGEAIPDRKLVNAVHTHDLNNLIALAGLTGDLQAARQSVLFDSHWAAVSNWTEAARYDVIDVSLATAMRDAMMDERAGLFQWLQQRW